MNTYFPLEFFDELSQAKTLGDILHSTSYWINHIFQADRVSVALQQDPKFLSLFALTGSEVIPIDRPIPIENTMVGNVFTSKQLSICNDTSVETLIDCQWLTEGGLLSCMDAPLISEDKCYGTINIAHKDKDHFTEQDAQVLKSLVSWVAAQIRTQKQMVKMEALANIDTLTGILNRRAFIEATKLINHQPRASDKDHALLIIDIDNFKSLNDKYGHLGGDDVLVAMSRRIQAIKRKDDLFARIGGEEFVLLLSDITEPNAVELAEKYRQSLEKMTVYFNNNHIKFTVSIGISSPRTTDSNFRDVISRADNALYKAKQAGRNKVFCWSD
ncbi:sensor domain-containing diguanylate cyclase [Vibrio makurazakiensis]|uniref:sensor domain-containing diguanylate cyclase n=1 Tax=Vibrio makurazakiensis TaxID=2910250 RepID=UPI003D10F288